MYIQMTVPFEVNFARHRASVIYYIIFFEKIKVKIQKKENGKSKNVLGICGELDKVCSREDAYKILNKGSLKKEDIVRKKNKRILESI